MIKSPLILKDLYLVTVFFISYLYLYNLNLASHPFCCACYTFHCVFFFLNGGYQSKEKLALKSPTFSIDSLTQHGKMLAASQAKSCIPWRWFIMWITVDLSIVNLKQKTVFKWNMHRKLHVWGTSHTRSLLSGKYWAERPCQAWTESIGCRVWETQQPWLAHGWLNLPWLSWFTRKYPEIARLTWEGVMNIDEPLGCHFMPALCWSPW